MYFVKTAELAGPLFHSTSYTNIGGDPVGMGIPLAPMICVNLLPFVLIFSHI